MRHTPEQDHAFIATFSAGLARRPDAEQVRCSLAAAFAYHASDIWPQGNPNATPNWIATHTDEILATIGRLYALAIEGDRRGTAEFLERMAWLPELLHKITNATPGNDA